MLFASRPSESAYINPSPMARRPKESKVRQGRKKAVYSLHPDDHPDDYSKQSYYDTPDSRKFATAEQIIY